MSRHYRVVVRFHEPLFEEIIGRKGDPYEVLYVVKADDPGGAVEAAMQVFSSDARLSSVHWERVVQSTRVTETTESEAKEADAARPAPGTGRQAAPAERRRRGDAC